MHTTLPITGGCACGKIRYEINAQPLFMYQCHCRDCQQATGGLYAPNVWFPVAAITLSGETKCHSVETDAGNTASHDFCGDCGSPIGMRTSSTDRARGFRAATLDDWSWLEPMANIYMKNSPPWEVTNADLQVFDGAVPDEFTAQMIRNQREIS